MKDLIACCGLNCEKCDARIATMNDDDALREDVARLWSEMNQVHITKEMINCMGCRVDGVKTPYCDSLCEIRKCALSKGYGTCAECAKIESCETVGMVLGNNLDARENLKGMR